MPSIGDLVAPSLAMNKLEQDVWTELLVPGSTWIGRKNPFRISYMTEAIWWNIPTSKPDHVPLPIYNLLTGHDYGTNIKGKRYRSKKEAMDDLIRAALLYARSPEYKEIEDV